jgi:CheY-like chemotaxis protein
VGEFRFREFCNELIKDLNESLGDKNIFRLSLDIQLSEMFGGNPESLIQAIRGISDYLTGLLINGTIAIEIVKLSENNNHINVLVKIIGKGPFRTGNLVSKDEVNSQFKNLSYSIQYEANECQMIFSFQVDLYKNDKQKNVERLPFEKKRILLAEDNELNAMVFTSFLEEWGCAVTSAGNGEEAVKLAFNFVFDAILMDIYMPVLNGNLATSKIREFNATIPIIALTASTVEQDILDAMKAGASDYLLKPVSSKDLFRVLSKYL